MMFSEKRASKNPNLRGEGAKAFVKIQNLNHIFFLWLHLGLDLEEKKIKSPTRFDHVSRQKLLKLRREGALSEAVEK